MNRGIPTIAQVAMIATAGLVLALVSCVDVRAADRGPAAGEGETVTFRFRPPDGTQFVESLKTTRTRSIGDQGQQSDVMESDTATSIESRQGGGYLVTTTVTKMQAMRDGVAVNDPLSALLHGAAIKYQIDDSAQISGVDGFGALSEKLESVVPPKVAAALAPLLSEDALVAQATEEWNGRIGEFAGQTVMIGGRLTGKRPFKLPNGEEMEYEVSVSFPKREACGERSCVRVETFYDSDAAKFAEFSNKVVAKAAGEAGDSPTPGVQSTAARLYGTSSRLIDPQTMLIYAETQERTIALSVNIPGQGTVPMKMTESREYTFDYE